MINREICEKAAASIICLSSGVNYYLLVAQLYCLNSGRIISRVFWFPTFHFCSTTIKCTITRRAKHLICTYQHRKVIFLSWDLLNTQITKLLYRLYPKIRSSCYRMCIWAFQRFCFLFPVISITAAFLWPYPQSSVSVITSHPSIWHFIQIFLLSIFDLLLKIFGWKT